jgi:hypothetical protein
MRLRARQKDYTCKTCKIHALALRRRSLIVHYFSNRLECGMLDTVREPRECLSMSASGWRMMLRDYARDGGARSG